MAILQGELQNPEYEESTIQTQLTEWDKVFTAKGITWRQLYAKLRSWDMTIEKLPEGADKVARKAQAAALRAKGAAAKAAEEALEDAEPEDDDE